jgi:hypothetical protein
VNETFGPKNPKRLYLVGDVLHDCATRQPAVFRAAWFNTSTVAYLRGATMRQVTYKER